jgi:hypothetical protein
LVVLRGDVVPLDDDRAVEAPRVSGRRTSIRVVYAARDEALV